MKINFKFLGTIYCVDRLPYIWYDTRVLYLENKIG